GRDLVGWGGLRPRRPTLSVLAEDQMGRDLVGWGGLRPRRPTLGGGGAWGRINTMDQRHVVRMLAMVRIAIGVVAFVAPRRAGALAFGARTPSPAFEQVTRAFGARDVVLGVGTLRALDRDVDAEGWARMSAAGDASDVA